MKLVLKNNVDKKQYEFTVNDIGDSDMFYHFEDVQLPSGLSEGEYSYFLYDNDNNLVAQGLAQIGTFVEEQTKYTGSTNQTYIQYQG